jgi:hypothetical protein
LKARIWENKSLARIQDKIKSYFQKVAGEDLPTGSDERRYCFTLLAYCARVSAKDLAHFFVAELNQDPVRWDEEGKEKVIRKLHSLDIEVAEKFLLVVLPHLPQALQNWFSS